MLLLTSYKHHSRPDVYRSQNSFVLLSLLQCHTRTATSGIYVWNWPYRLQLCFSHVNTSAKNAGGKLTQGGSLLVTRLGLPQGKKRSISLHDLVRLASGQA